MPLLDLDEMMKELKQFALNKGVFIWSSLQARRHDMFNKSFNRLKMFKNNFSLRIQPFLTAGSVDRVAFSQAKTFLDVFIRLPKS